LRCLASDSRPIDSYVDIFWRVRRQSAQQGARFDEAFSFRLSNVASVRLLLRRVGWSFGPSATPTTSRSIPLEEVFGAASSTRRWPRRVTRAQQRLPWGSGPLGEKTRMAVNTLAFPGQCRPVQGFSPYQREPIVWPGFVSRQIRLQDFTFRGFPTKTAAHLSVPLLSCRCC
jgi:hypothetical protein